MPTRSCSICGTASMAHNCRWFLVAENVWEDKLKILEWNEQLAWHNAVHQACSVGHVQQLVVHWMTTGSLDYPFAQPVVPGFRVRSQAPAIDCVAVPPQPIGELAVHRESMKRVLSESPHSLKGILDALLSALQKDAPKLREQSLGEEDELQLVWER